MQTKTVPLLFVIIVTTAAIANILGTFFFWPRATSSDKFLQFSLCIANGCLFAQPSLIAVWWSSVNQPFVRRTYLCAGSFALLFVSYTMAINGLNRSAELYLPLFFLAIAAGVFGLVSLVHWIVLRLLLRAWIKADADSNSNGEKSNLTFNLKQLFVASAIASICCAVFRFVFPPMTVEPGLPIPWRAIFDFVLAITILLSGISLAATFCVFTNRLSIWLLGLLFLLTGPLLALEFWTRYSASAFGPISISGTEIVLLIDAFLIGFFLMSFGVLFCFKKSGYHLVNQASISE